MEILVSTGVVPNGVGIAQDGMNLIALSPCCGAPVHFNWDTDYDWDCSDCAKEIPVTYSVDRNEFGELTSKKAELEAWVALWLEVPVEDVYVVRRRK